MFFAQASGRDDWLPALLCDWVTRMSWSNRMRSICADSVVYCVVRLCPQLLDWNTASKGGWRSCPVYR